MNITGPTYQRIAPGMNSDNEVAFTHPCPDPSTGSNDRYISITGSHDSIPAPGTSLEYQFAFTLRDRSETPGAFSVLPYLCCSVSTSAVVTVFGVVVLVLWDEIFICRRSIFDLHLREGEREREKRVREDDAGLRAHARGGERDLLFLLFCYSEEFFVAISRVLCFRIFLFVIFF